MANTPPIEIRVMASTAPLGGGGEPGLPGVAPALVNAIAAAGGPRIRALPVTKQGLDYA
jgi:isoquinoline 1-oxidoreductase beta subunit